MIERPHFTEPYLKSLPLPAPGKRVVHWDGANPGFGIRISDSGVKTFVAQKRLDGRPIMVTLGRFTGRNFNAMRKLYDQKVAEIEMGHHPTEMKREAKGTTLAQVVDDYVAIKLQDKRRGHEVESFLRRDWLGQEPTRARVTKPERDANGRILRTIDGAAVRRAVWKTEWSAPKGSLHSRPVVKINPEDIARRIDAVSQQRGKFAARHSLSAIRACLNWAAKPRQGYGMKYSPAVGMDADIDGKSLRRDRVLTNDELKAIWTATGEMGVYGVLVRVLMLSGQRLNDWAEAEHCEIADGVLTIPARRFKTNTAHAVPLTPRVVELLGTLPTFANCAYVFSLDGRSPFSNFTKEKRRLDKSSGVNNWKHHDLRRTVRTNLPRLGIVRHVAKAAIGHTVSSGVDAHYDLYEYLDEKRDALAKWEAELLRVVGHDNVATLPPKLREAA